MNIGDRIKNRRIELGLTQSELARKMGYTSRTSICTIEKNKENLTTSRVIKLAEALNTTPSYLMGWVDDPNLSKEEIFEKERSERLSAYANALTAQAHKANHENSPPPESLRIAMAYDNAPQHIKDAIKALLQIKEE